MFNMVPTFYGKQSEPQDVGGSAGGPDNMTTVSWLSSFAIRASCDHDDDDDDDGGGQVGPLGGC
jgi:hypothetical protein